MNLPTYHALSSQPVTPADAFAVSDDCYALIYHAAHLVQISPAHPNERVRLIMTRNHESAVREVLEDAKRRSFEVTDAADLLRRSHPELADELYELGTKARGAIEALNENDRESLEDCLYWVGGCLRRIRFLARNA